MFQNRKIFIVGHGKAGAWLFNQLHLNDLIENENHLSGKSAKLGKSCSDKSVFFLAVPDRYIESVALSYRLLLPDNCDSWFVHLSGSQPSQSLLNKTNLPCASFHPAFSIPSKSDSDFKISLTVAIEGDPEVCSWLTNLSGKLGFEPIKILPDQKKLYHAACVIAGSLNSLYYHRLCELFLKIGFNSDQSKSTVKNLINSSIYNIDNFGIKDGLTGPIARGDIETQDSNLKALSEHDKQMADLYRVLSSLSKEENLK